MKAPGRYGARHSGGPRQGRSPRSWPTRSSMRTLVPMPRRASHIQARATPPSRRRVHPLAKSDCRIPSSPSFMCRFLKGLSRVNCGHDEWAGLQGNNMATPHSFRASASGSTSCASKRSRIGSFCVSASGCIATMSAPSKRLPRSTRSASACRASSSLRSTGADGRRRLPTPINARVVVFWRSWGWSPGLSSRQRSGRS